MIYWGRNRENRKKCRKKQRKMEASLLALALVVTDGLSGAGGVVTVRGQEEIIEEEMLEQAAGCAGGASSFGELQIEESTVAGTRQRSGNLQETDLILSMETENRLSGREATNGQPGTESGNKQLGAGAGDLLLNIESESGQSATRPGEKQSATGTGGMQPDTEPGSMQLNTESGERQPEIELGSVQLVTEHGEVQSGTQPVTESGSEQPGTQPGTEPGTEQPGTRPGTQPGTEPGTEQPGTEPGSEQPGTPQQSEKVYLGIDNRHLYDGMEQAFSNGYQPKVENGSVYLTVPFTASGKLRGDRLTVTLRFEDKENSPFVFSNYQKEITKRYYVEVDGRMTELAHGVAGTDAAVSGNDTASAQLPGDTSTGASGSTDGTSPGAGGSSGGTSTSGSLSGNGGSGNSAAQSGVTETYLYTCQIPLQATAAPGQYSVTVSAQGYTEQQEQVSLDCQVFIVIPEEPVAASAGGGASGGGSFGGGGSGGGSFGGETAEEIIRQPKMLLERCNLSGKELEAGKQETLSVSFQNRSETQAMYNLKIVASADPTAILLEKNSFYFAKVAPGEEISLESGLHSALDAAAGAVPVTFEFEYEDKKGNAETGRESLTLMVVQPVKMELDVSDLPSSMYASDILELPMKALNLSRTAVYNVRMELSGEGLFPTGTLFLGNMEAGKEDGGTMRVYVGTRTMEAPGSDDGTTDQEKYGPVSGTITLEYEDAFGETHEITKEYQSEIKKAQVLSLKVDEEEPEENSWWISVFAILIAGLGILVVLLVWRLRRKNVLLEEARKSSHMV